MPSWLIFSFRIIFACYSVSTLIYSIVLYETWTWLVYLTNWNLAVTTIYFVWLAILSGLYGLNVNTKNARNSGNEEYDMDNERNDDSTNIKFTSGSSMPIHLKLFWVWFNLAYIGCIVMVVMYWSFVVEDEHLTSKFVFSYVNDHAINMVLLLIDFCFHEITFRFLHAVYTVVYALIYVVVNIVYQFAADKPVYKVMDWKDDTAWAVFYIVLAILLVFIGQAAMLGLHVLKTKLRK